MLRKLTDALKRSLASWRAASTKNAVLTRIAQLERTLMKQIEEYATRVNQAFDAISTSVDELSAAQEGVAKDVTFLKDEIAKLQNSPGTLTPEDQARLDSIESRLAGLVTRTQGISASLKSLDDATDSAPATPPAPEPAPENPPT